MAAKHAMVESEAAIDRQPEPASAAKRDSSARAVAGTTGGASGENLDFLLDIPLEITIELGRTRMMINDLLKLGQGSVIELAKEAGDTLEILANNRLIAKGDVVVVNKKYAIRLTEVISPVERVEKLG
mgnify:CR=1 FL=1